jgi:SAM-dependent methyltransferase
MNSGPDWASPNLRVGIFGFFHLEYSLMPSYLNYENFRQENGIFYDDDAQTLSFPEEYLDEGKKIEENSFWHVHRAKCIVAAVKRWFNASSIIDIGAGNGYNAMKLAEAGLDVAVFEPNPAGARNAQKRGITHVVCGLFDEKNVKADSVAAVGLFDVLEHIEDDEKFLASIRSLLTSARGGGEICITVPACHFLWSAKDDYIQHYRRYSLNQLERLFDSAGYDVVYSTYFFSFLVAPIFLLKSLPYRCFRRKIKSNDKKVTSDHKTRLPALLSPFTQWEQSRIASGKKIGCGSSCLLIASKR